MLQLVCSFHRIARCGPLRRGCLRTVEERDNRASLENCNNWKIISIHFFYIQVAYHQKGTKKEGRGVVCLFPAGFLKPTHERLISSGLSTRVGQVS